MTSAHMSRRDWLRRSGLATIGILGGPSLLAACASAPSSTSTTTQQAEQPVKGGKFVESFGLPLGLNPISFSGSFDIRAQYYFFTGLLAPKINGEPQPDLATAMPTLSSDGKTFTFSLNKNAKWSDGKPLTADDVVYTYQLHTLPQYSTIKSAFRTEISALIQEVKATDPYTVVITLKNPSASFLTNHGIHRIVPKHVLGGLSNAEFASATYSKNPTVTCGPFNFKSWDASFIVGTRNETYFRGAPYFDTFVANVSGAGTDLLKTGEVTGAMNKAFATFDDLKKDPNLIVGTFDATGPHLYFNMDPNRPSYKVLGSKSVRKALLYAADRPGTVKAIYGQGSVHKSTGILPPFSWANNPDGKPEYPYDPKKAEELLDADGWRKGANGMRSKDGLPLSFELLKNTEKSWEEVMTVFQENWKAIGVDLKTRRVAYAQMLADSMINHSFDACIIISPSFFSADPDLSLRLHSRNAVRGGSNWGNFKNAEADKLLEQGAIENDREKRKAIYFKLQDIMNEEVTSFSPQFWKNSWVYNKRLKGMEANKEIGVYGYTGTVVNKGWFADGMGPS